MYFGYLTLYMLEFGMTKKQVGVITSINLTACIFFALISAYVTDRFGRKNTSLIFDVIGWGATQIIWIFAKNIYFFLAATILNAFGYVVNNSWHCLMLEDSKPEIRVHIFNFLQMAGIIAGFMAPIGSLLIKRLTLVPAMRIMISFGFFSMMALFIGRHFMVSETSVGLRRMREVKGVGILNTLKTYRAPLKRIVDDRLLLIILLMRALNFIQLTVRNTFLAVLVTERLHFPAEMMAVFHILTAAVMLFVILLITPLLSRVTRRWPITLGICFHLIATAVLLLAPPAQNYTLLIISAVFIALGTAITTPRIDALAANTIKNEERSVVNAVVAVILLLLSTPFGFIGGVLSEIDARLPFLLTFTLFLVCLLLLGLATRIEKNRILHNEEEIGK